MNKKQEHRLQLLSKHHFRRFRRRGMRAPDCVVLRGFNYWDEDREKEKIGYVAVSFLALMRMGVDGVRGAIRERARRLGLGDPYRGRSLRGEFAWVTKRFLTRLQERR